MFEKIYLICSGIWISQPCHVAEEETRPHVLCLDSWHRASRALGISSVRKVRGVSLLLIASPFYDTWIYINEATLGDGWLPEEQPHVLRSGTFSPIPPPTSGENRRAGNEVQPTTVNNLINCANVMKPPLKTLNDGVQRDSGRWAHPEKASTPALWRQKVLCSGLLWAIATCASSFRPLISLLCYSLYNRPVNVK